MITLWKFLAWISLACGLTTYLIGWAALASQSEVWGVPTQFWFYDAVSAGIFAVFFLLYGWQAQRSS